MRQVLRMRKLPESAPHALGLAEFILGRLHRSLHPPLLDGSLARLEDLISDESLNRPAGLCLKLDARANQVANYETLGYDVLIIGAGGAGLRAAIEASAAGVKVGLVCKSLLGKAHTVRKRPNASANWKAGGRSSIELRTVEFFSAILVAIAIRASPM
jgi:hypothetical protein